MMSAQIVPKHGTFRMSSALCLTTYNELYEWEMLPRSRAYFPQETFLPVLGLSFNRKIS